MNKLRSKYCLLQKSLDRSIRERCTSNFCLPRSNVLKSAEKQFMFFLDQSPAALRVHPSDHSADHNSQGSYLPASQADFYSCPRRHNNLFLFQPDRSSDKLWSSSQTDKTNCRVIRPLLNCSRTVITAICRYGKMPIYPDQSNQNVRYARNRLRKQILPGIQLFLNPKAEDALFQFAELVSHEQDLVSCLICTTSKTPDSPDSSGRGQHSS